MLAVTSALAMPQPAQAQAIAQPVVTGPLVAAPVAGAPIIETGDIRAAVETPNIGIPRKPVIERPTAHPDPAASPPLPAPTADDPAANPDISLRALPPIVTRPTADPVIDPPQPAARIEWSVTQPVIERPTAQPVIDRPTARPVVDRPAVRPVVDRPEAQPVIQRPAAQPVIDPPQPQVGIEWSITQPVIERPVADPVIVPPAVPRPVVKPRPVPVPPPPHSRPAPPPAIRTPAPASIDADVPERICSQQESEYFPGDRHLLPESYCTPRKRPKPKFPRPAAPQPACHKGPYIVFFDWDKSRITEEAATTLDAVIRAYPACAPATIVMTGHADRSGSDGYNIALSERRNAAIARYLAERGLKAAPIRTEANGERVPRVPTPDGVREFQNRRVEITLVPSAKR